MKFTNFLQRQILHDKFATIHISNFSWCHFRVGDYMFILGHPTSAPGFSIWVSSFPKCAMIEKAIWCESSESLVSFSLGGWQVDNYSAKLFSELETLKV